MMDQYYDLLIVSYLKGETTELQDKELYEWGCKSDENLRYFAEMKAIAHCVSYGTMTGSTKPRRTKSRKMFYRTAASACAAVLISVGIFFYDRLNNVTIENDTATCMEISLPDQSMVWLSEGSYIRYNARKFSAKRNVHLIGSADFDVTKNATKEFRVLTPSLEIKVHGTVFNVADFPADDIAETTLAKGSISLKTSNSRGWYNVLEGQKVTFDEKSGDIQVLNVDTNSIIMRRFGITSIEDATINEVAERIMNDYGVKLLISRIGDRDKEKFTFSYTKEASLEDVMSLVETISGYRFIVDNN